MTTNHPITQAEHRLIARAHADLVTAGIVYRRAPADETHPVTVIRRKAYRDAMAKLLEAAKELGINVGEPPEKAIEKGNP